MKTTSVEWQGDMLFKGIGDSKHELMMDAAEANGGKDSGLRPKELLLLGLGGCSGMDVISILKKMRIVPDSFSVKITADVTEEHPIIYKDIHLQYIFTGDVLQERVERAVELSQTKYCGVNAMLNTAAKISYEVIIN